MTFELQICRDLYRMQSILEFKIRIINNFQQNNSVGLNFDEPVYRAMSYLRADQVELCIITSEQLKTSKSLYFVE